jgi:ketosteroid isomerase-like protein
VRRRRKERRQAMGIRKRTLVAWGMAVASLALLAGVLGMPKPARPAAAQADRCEAVQQATDTFNRGEIDLLLEDYADDFVFVTGPICNTQKCIGKDAYRNYLEYLVALDTQMTVTSCQVSGNTIALTNEVRGRDVREQGVDRLIVSSSIEFQGDTVLSNTVVGVDLTDPQTAQYVNSEYGTAHLTFAMGPGRDADQSPGVVLVERYPDFSGVAVRIAPGLTGVPQPVNIHEGTCADLGPVAFALTDMAGGVSHTVLDGVPGSDLQKGNLAIAVQKSHDQPDVYVACADIPAAAAQVPPAEAPAVAPAPAGELPSAGSGGLLGEEGSSLPTWWYALAAGGVLLLAGGVWAARRRWLR